MSDFFKRLEAFLIFFLINVGFFNVRHFERVWGFVNIFSNKWGFLFWNVRLLKDICREVDAFLNDWRFYKDNDAF
jgi:hypothetical protein